MSHLLNNFPPGPLDRYRRTSSFDWKKLKIFLEGENIIEFQNKLLKRLENDPLFHQPTRPLTLDELRHLTAKKMIASRKVEQFLFEEHIDRPDIIFSILTTVFHMDPGLSIKYSIAYGMVVSVLLGLGSSRHHDYIEEIHNGKILACFCLTEIGHGSNAKCMKTTATFDKTSQEFILNSPNFEAAKCWAALLGQSATHAVVYAQLITPDKVKHGLHAFFVKIRDPETLLPYPGITVGDMGEKIGLNGMDNGFLIFNNYHIPRTDLLNKTGDVTVEGEYVTPFRDSNKRYGASLGALSTGRINITGMCSAYASKAVSIAIRYSAVRKQFGPEDAEEMPILEYQTHQHRLIPHLAVSYVLRMASKYLVQVHNQFLKDSMMGAKKDQISDMGLELHAISSASKPVASWTVRDAIQECREACGGHGYLKAAGLGDLRNVNDANCTYEGENHVLIQQTSNWLLKMWPLVLRGEPITTPLKSADFISDALKILKTKYNAKNCHHVESPDHIIKAFQWMTCFLLKTTHEKIGEYLKQGFELFWAKNDNQVFFARNLAVVYIQHFFLQRFLVVINEAPEPALKNVLTKLFSLYGVWTLEKHLATLFQGGYITKQETVYLMQNSILRLCHELKHDAVSLVDVIGPCDFLMDSVLGKSDGLVYKHLQDSMMREENIARPIWWKSIIGKNLNSKI